MITNKIAIYANGSSAIGLGHIMRTMAIAEELNTNGYEVTYIVDNSDEAEVDLIRKQGFNLLFADRPVSYFLKQADYKYDAIIADSYDIEEDNIMELYEVAEAVVYIDDLMRFKEYNMDLLINSGANANEGNYKGKAKKLLGPQYALLRKEFRNLDYKLPKAEIKKVLITLGGSDINNTTKKILDLLLSKYDLEFNVVLGNSYKYKDEMKNEYQIKNVKFHINVENMRQLISEQDLALSAGGNTLYELCACGIPTIALITADNQEKFVHAMNVQTNMPFVDTRHRGLVSFTNMFQEVLQDYYFRKRLSYGMYTLIDGKGSQRVSEEIMSLVNK